MPKRGSQGNRPPPGTNTKLAILEAARKRLRDGQPIYEITLAELAADCGVTRAAAAFHYRDVRAVAAGLALELAARLEQEIESQVPEATGSPAAAVARVTLLCLLDSPGTAAAVQAMRWGWRSQEEEVVTIGFDIALKPAEKYLPRHLPPKLVLGLAEYFFGEVHRRTMSRKSAEAACASLVDALGRLKP